MLLYVLLAYTLATLTLVSSRNQAPIIATEIPTARLADIGTSHQDDYASFSHPSFPRHGLRIKKVHDFCDPTVNVYSGFLDFTSGGSKVVDAVYRYQRLPVLNFASIAPILLVL